MGEHERAHVAFLRKALGNQADPKPTFDFGNTTTDGDRFAATAAMLEDTAVAAYNGQAANLTKPTLKAAATIVSVEARHAAWIRDIVGKPASPQATDTPATARQVQRVIARTGFVATCAVVTMTPPTAYSPMCPSGNPVDAGAEARRIPVWMRLDDWGCSRWLSGLAGVDC